MSEEIVLRKKKPKKGGKRQQKGAAAAVKKRGSSATESDESKVLQRGSRGGSEDDDDEVSSEVSHLSLDDDLGSVMGDHDQDLESIEEEETGETFEKILENTLSEHLDNATHKNSTIRIKAMKNVQALLCRYHLPDILTKWKMTLTDVIERALSLRKNQISEGLIGLKLAGLLAVQLGIEVSELIVKLSPTIRTHLTDDSLNLEYRAECALVLGVITFLTVDELEPVLQTLESLKSVWLGVKPGAHNQPETVPLFCSSVRSWALLLAQAPRRRQEEALNSDLPKLCAYLKNDQVEIRIAAGEGLALLYELGQDMRKPDTFSPPNHDHTIDLLQELATDALKYRAKRERRVQRCSFRQIFWAIKEQDPPSLTVKFSGEEMVLGSWSEKLCYDTFCLVVRGGMNAHLKGNELIRNIFDLGPVYNGDRNRAKFSKLNEKTGHSIAFKARTLQRGKQRDKRVASFE